MSLFDRKLSVINIGLPSFAENLTASGVENVHLQWKPPLFNCVFRELSAFNQLLSEKSAVSEKVLSSSEKAVSVIQKADPVLTDIGIAIEVIPGMRKDLFLHAGPPVTWDKMSGPLRGAVIGAVIFEKMASDEKEAEALARSGKISYEPCHHHSCVGPMAGVISPSMPVFMVKNTSFGNFAFCTLNEGLGKVLRYGAFSPEVITRLTWMKDTLAPVLKETLKLMGNNLNLKNLIAQALLMGDEGHNRNKAGTSLFIRETAPYMVRTGFSQDQISECLNFIHQNDHFFLNLTMPAAKCTVQPAEGIEFCPIITTMSRNGTEFGIRLSCMPDLWFTGPAQHVRGLYFPGFTASDANPDIGDSVITETAGFGGFAMAGAPAIVRFVGGTPADAVKVTMNMFEITQQENEVYRIPVLGFRGTPTGLNLIKIIETGILPAINTGIAHKDPGVGQIGAGLVDPPVECFIRAFQAYTEKMLENR